MSNGTLYDGNHSTVSSKQTLTEMLQISYRKQLDDKQDIITSLISRNYSTSNVQDNFVHKNVNDSFNKNSNSFDKNTKSNDSNSSAAPTETTEQTTQSSIVTDTKKLTIIGDSLINGILPSWFDKCENIKVKVKPFGGSTTEDMQDHVKSILKRKPDMLILLHRNKLSYKYNRHNRKTGKTRYSGKGCKR